MKRMKKAHITQGDKGEESPIALYSCTPDRRCQKCVSMAPVEPLRISLTAFLGPQTQPAYSSVKKQAIGMSHWQEA